VQQTAKIYKITNDINDKVYVGQTWRELKVRYRAHCTSSNKDSNRTSPILLAIQKYGKEHFKIELLLEFPFGTKQSVVDQAETEWGLKLNTLSPFGYNLKLGQGRGICSDDTKRKLSLINKGRFVSKETRKKQSLAHIGVKHTPTQNKNKSLRLKGIRPSIQAQIANKLAVAKHYTLISPEGEVIEIYNMAEFSRKHGLNSVRMCRLHKGQITEHKGWKKNGSKIISKTS